MTNFDFKAEIKTFKECRCRCKGFFGPSALGPGKLSVSTATWRVTGNVMGNNCDFWPCNSAKCCQNLAAEHHPR